MNKNEFLSQKVEYSKDGYLIFKSDDWSSFDKFLKDCNKYFFPYVAIGNIKRVKIEQGFKISVKLVERQLIRQLKVGEFILLVIDIANLI